MTIREWLNRATERLQEAGVENARLDAELLLERVLGRPRLLLLSQSSEILDTAAMTGLGPLLERRALREPFQHIVGFTSFCGFEIGVGPDVLIPRSETELLAEAGWKFMNGRTHEPRLLDWGTGSGCIAIAIMSNCPAARALAVDRCANALAMAERNARLNGVGDRVEFLLSDGFERVPSGDRFDLIVSNPPYIPASEIPGLQPEVRDHDPTLALDGGLDGMDCYRVIARRAGAFLKEGGAIMLEFGDGQDASVAEIFEREGWRIDKTCEDLSGRFRFLIAGLKST